MFQKSCIDFTIQARPLERYMPNKRNSFKYKIWRLVVSTPFEYFIMMLIVFNTLLLMMKVIFVLFLQLSCYKYFIILRLSSAGFIDSINKCFEVNVTYNIKSAKIAIAALQVSCPKLYCMYKIQTTCDYLW